MENPSRILFDGSVIGLDNIKIYWYGALILVGIVAAALLAGHEVKRKKLHPDTVVDLCLLCLPLGVIGARLYYVIFQWSSFYYQGIGFWEFFKNVISIQNGGLAIYGAVIGGVIGVLIYSKSKKIHFLSLADVVIPGVVLAQAIGRWGNYFNQEAYGGVIADGFPKVWPLVVKIDQCTQPCCANLASQSGNLHYATFFYESMCCLAIFLVLWFLVRKRAKHRGDSLVVYCMMYGFERMLIEGLRTDSLMWGSVRVSQLLSGMLFAAAFLFIVIRAVIEKKKGVVIWPAEEVYLPGYSANYSGKKKRHNDDSSTEASDEDSAQADTESEAIDAQANDADADKSANANTSECKSENTGDAPLTDSKDDDSDDSGFEQFDDEENQDVKEDDANKDA